MVEPRLERFLFYSLLLHAAVLVSLLISSLLKENTKKYYTVDFYGEPSAPSGSSAAPAAQIEQKAAKEEPAKTKFVNPKEDLLIKSKKGEKKVREVISDVPSIPIPKPKAKKEEGGSSEIPSGIPSAADGSGVGVGFGPDGYRGGGSGAGNFPYQWYVQTIKKSLDSNWNVTEGFSKRIYTQIGYTIRRNGSLEAIEIEETSNNETFDRSAKRAVELSGPYPPLPRDYPESTLRVHVRFTVKR